MSNKKPLQDKTILLGVTGGIACYKAVDLASKLVQSGAMVDVVMTASSQEFVRPLSFAALTHRNVYSSMWENYEKEPQHISLSERSDLILIVPATGNTLAKLANGIADNLLTSILLATRAPILTAPAMNDNMWNHPATQANMKLLASRDVMTVGPAEGRLASGKMGLGRMSEPADILKAVIEMLS